MKKRKIKNRKLSRVFIIGSLFILLGITLISLKIYSNYYLDKQEDKAIQEYLDYKPDTTVKVDNSTTTIKEEKETVTYNYIAVLEIPKINLKRGLFPINDKNNNVDKNVEILKNSDMPNVTNGTLALAGHSGNSRIAYFHKLYKLKENDQVYIYYQNEKYIYQVSKIERQDKDGTISFTKTKDTTELILTTCDQQNKGKQIVVVAKLVDKIPY
ncbi:MAG TPA: sortase [Candidatus Onthocola stercorigallinarum]|nr:sortase [Candidatus Onthocola stercorigallinarum]